jgi:hypothetical protein
MNKILSDKDLKNLKAIFDSIEATHKGLGKLFIFEYLCELANESLMVISSPAMGKSKCSNLLFSLIPRTKLKLHAITINGLKKLAKILSNNVVSIIVDDLSRGRTIYSQVSTVSILSGLVYDGSAVKLTQQLTLSIVNFKGSAIVNLQPLILKRIVAEDEFETDVRDKTIRYYHLHMPIHEEIKTPALPDNIIFKYVEDILPMNIKKDKLYGETLENFYYAFTKARSKEHLNKLLSACALANSRNEIVDADVMLLHHYSKLFRLEPELFRKRHLEGKRQYDPDVLPTLAMVASYGIFTIDDLRLRFGLSERRAYEKVAELGEYIQLLRGSKKIIPTEKAKEILKEIGEL